MNTETISPVLVSLVGTVQNLWAPEDRVGLNPLIKSMANTAGDGRDQRRSYLIADWVARDLMPLALESAGHTDDAKALRSMPEVSGSGTSMIAFEYLRGLSHKHYRHMAEANNTICNASNLASSVLWQMGDGNYMTGISRAGKATYSAMHTVMAHDGDTTVVLDSVLSFLVKVTRP